MKFKRASIITKIVVLILLIYIAITLLSVRSKIQAANAAYQALQAQVDEQAAANAALASDIANKDDPDTVLPSPRSAWACWSRGRSFSTTRQIEKNAVGQREKRSLLSRERQCGRKIILWS